MIFRVYSKTNDEILDCNINDIIYSNRGYTLIKPVERGYYIFIGCVSKNNMDGAYQGIFIDDFCSHIMYYQKSVIPISMFDKDESDYIKSLCDGNINELFEYMEKRLVNIAMYINDAAINTKPICNVKRVN